MTSKGVIALILHFALNLIALQANYVTVELIMSYNVHKILSLSHSLPLVAKTNPPCSAVSAIAKVR